jgi:23S rRNA (uracil1939-C5)-methyltransferase
MEQVIIEKIVFGGQGMGRLGNKVVFIWGALPGETVTFRVTKKKKNFVEGVVEEIIVASPSRLAPREAHYMSCSPWQVISEADEEKWKITMAKETFSRLGKLTAPENLSLKTDSQSYGYRNKIEYSFALNEAGEICFAFHERGQYWKSTPQEHCLLASDAINATAHELLTWIRSAGFTVEQLKNLTVRSNLQGETIAALFTTNETWAGAVPALPKKCLGFQVWYSFPLSPAAVPTKLLAEAGEMRLSEKVRGVALTYGLHSFFQINIPLFEMALNDIAPYVSDGPVVDYYAGVGSIGLSTTTNKQPLKIIESNQEAVNFAKHNAADNDRTQVVFTGNFAERETKQIDPLATVIVDPPRAGLDPRMVTTLLEVRPKRLVYLSCDVATQARDLGLLTEGYTPVFWQLYNFFPRTPHIESLVILERK